MRPCSSRAGTAVHTHMQYISINRLAAFSHKDQRLLFRTIIVVGRGEERPLHDSGSKFRKGGSWTSETKIIDAMKIKRDRCAEQSLRIFTAA